MRNLIKMDFYRLFHSKALKVCIIVSVIVSFVGMLLNLGILEIIKLGTVDDPSSAADMEILFPIVAWLGGVDFADVVISGTGTFSLFIACMVASNFVGAEQSCGYVKNIAGQLSNRGLTIVSKFIITCFIQLLVLVIYTIVCSICAGIFFGSYITGYSIVGLVQALVLRFLLFCAIDAILLFFCTLAKSHAIAMVIGAIFGIGVTTLVYMGINALLDFLKITVNVAHIMPDGINGLIRVANVGDIAVRAIVVAVVFIVAFVGGSVWIFRKRDVR